MILEQTIRKINEGVEDEHAVAIDRFEKYKKKLSSSQKKEFARYVDAFDNGYEEDDDDEMYDALDDMLRLLKKARIPMESVEESAHTE